MARGSSQSESAPSPRPPSSAVELHEVGLGLWPRHNRADRPTRTLDCCSASHYGSATRPRRRCCSDEVGERALGHDRRLLHLVKQRRRGSIRRNRFPKQAATISRRWRRRRLLFPDMAATRTLSAPDARASTNAGVGPVIISDVLIANLEHLGVATAGPAAATGERPWFRAEGGPGACKIAASGGGSPRGCPGARRTLR